MIEFQSVSKTFRNGTAAVVDLSLRVPTDQVTVVVGPPGSGKTTTVAMVNRLIEPTSGAITWDGTPLRSRRKTALRRQLGSVVQGGGLFPHRTVVDNIATVPGLLGWSKAKTQTRSLALLERVGLDRTVADRYPVQLTGGQQVRVAIARALAANPTVLLMDEPFAGVDPEVRSELHQLFRMLQREISLTVILASSEIDEAVALGDQVAILGVGGRLAQVGTPRQLLEEPADAFVEGFVGRDRGYRALSFLSADGLSLHGVKVVRDPTAAAGGEPTLVLDADARPTGWVDADRPGELLPLGATFDVESGDLRSALDAALTSPFGLAVGVGARSRFAGVASADTILASLRSGRPAPAVVEGQPSHGYGDHAWAELGAESGDDVDAIALEPEEAGVR